MFRSLTRCLLAGAALTATAGLAAASPASPTTALHLRAGPGSDYDVIGVLPDRATVDVRNCNGGWCQVAYHGRTGWASRSYLSFETAAGGPGPREPQEVTITAPRRSYPAPVERTYVAPATRTYVVPERRTYAAPVTRTYVEPAAPAPERYIVEEERTYAAPVYERRFEDPDDVVVSRYVDEDDVPYDEGYDDDYRGAY